MSYLTNDDVVKLINAFCDKYDTYALAAKAFRCTPSQLSQARASKRGIVPAPILKKLGLKPLTLYTSRSGKPVKSLAPKVEFAPRQQGKSAASKSAASKSRLQRNARLPAAPRPWEEFAPGTPVVAALKPADRILSTHETDFEDAEPVDLDYEAPTLHVNAFGDD